MQPSLTQPPMSGDENAPPPTNTLPPLSPQLPAQDAEPAPPITDTPPPGKLKDSGILLPKALVDDLYREARKNYALIPDMTFALAAGARELRDMWEQKDGKFTRKDRPFANYVPPKDDDRGASLLEPSTAMETASNFLRQAEAEEASYRDAERPPSGDERINPTASDELNAPDRLFEASLASSDSAHHEQRAAISTVAAAMTARGALKDVRIEKPNSQSWDANSRRAADDILGRIAATGDAIQKYGSAEEKEAWKQIKRIVLGNDPTRTGGAAENDGDTLRVDLTKMGRGGDPKTAPDPNFVFFMLVHEIFHGTKSDRAAQAAARRMQGGSRQSGERKIGTPEWSAEVRHDKRVYDFLLKTGLLGSPPPPIERIAPYYYEHLKNPRVPVYTFPVPGYDRPLN